MNSVLDMLKQEFKSTKSPDKSSAGGFAGVVVTLVAVAPVMLELAREKLSISLIYATVMVVSGIIIFSGCLLLEVRRYFRDRSSPNGDVFWIGAALVCSLGVIAASSWLVEYAFNFPDLTLAFLPVVYFAGLLSIVALVFFFALSEKDFSGPVQAAIFLMVCSVFTIIVTFSARELEENVVRGDLCQSIRNEVKELAVSPSFSEICPVQ